MVNVSYRKVGGLNLLKIGRLTFSWSVSKKYKPIKGSRAATLHPAMRAPTWSHTDLNGARFEGGYSYA